MKTVLGVLALIAIVLLLITVMWPRVDPARAELRDLQADHALARERALQPLRVWTGRLFQAALAAVLLAVIVWAGSFAVAGVTSVAALRDRITVWALTTYPKNALYAAPVTINQDRTLTILPPPNAGHAQEVAALVNGAQPPPRLNGQAAKALLAPPAEEDLPALEPPADLRPEAVVRPDPQTSPDVLVVGQKGSGKTNVLRWLIAVYQRALPDAEFMILSTIGSNWGDMQAITDPQDIHRAMLALRAEGDRRDAAMQLAGVRDFHRWPAAPPRVVVVMDEAEAVADSLALTDRRTAREFTGTLRMAVNTGRNFGFMFIVGTQTARTDVLDPSFMRNAATVLMMRMDSATAARFAVYGPEIVAALPTLPTGRAYNPQQGGYVAFPLVDRLPRVRLAGIYRAALALPADAEADGLGLADAPDGTPGTVLAEGGSTAVYAASLPLPPAVPARVPYAIPPETSVERLTPAQRRLIIETYKRRPSLRGVERRLWPDLQHGGAKFYLVREVVQAAGLLTAEAEV